MGAKKDKTISEPKLLKALAEIKEAALKKGDALEGRDPEGGFSTEGTPLSNAAPRGKGEAKKSSAVEDDESVEKSDDDASSDDGSDDDAAKAMSASDFGSDDESDDSPPKKSKKKDKGKNPFAKGGDSASDGESDDVGDDTEKSFRPEEDETVAKAIDVSTFLEALTDQIGVAFRRMAKSFSTELQAAEGRINARIDNRVAKSTAFQHDFNTRMAKAIQGIGETVQGDLVDLVKSLSNQPASRPQGKALLSKSEVNQPPWSGGGNGAVGSDDGDVDLSKLTPSRVGDWLFAKSQSNEIDPKLIMMFEANRYDVTTLPEEIQKSLVSDLCK